MILGPDRMGVIRNIRQAFEEGRFNDKVETADPVLSPDEKEQLLRGFVHMRQSPLYPLGSWWVEQVVKGGENHLVRLHTTFDGQEKLDGLEGGAIFTSNHFNHLDPTIVRTFARQHGHGHLYVVVGENSLLLPGLLGKMVDHADILLLSTDRSYLRSYFLPRVREILSDGGWILIYPEQEMWWNYKRPRPGKRGAYWLAADMRVPVVSCFTEQINEEKMDVEPFHHVRYVFHVLGVLEPDGKLGRREDSIRLAQEDWRLKVEAFERLYGRSINEPFSWRDIAGLEAPLTPSGS